MVRKRSCVQFTLWAPKLLNYPLFKFGHIREEESEFAFNYKPLQNNQMELSYVKDVNGFDVKVSSNYSMVSQIPDYGANIEVLSTF